MTYDETLEAIMTEAVRRQDKVTYYALQTAVLARKGHSIPIIMGAHRHMLSELIKLKSTRGS